MINSFSNVDFDKLLEMNVWIDAQINADFIRRHFFMLFLFVIYLYCVFIGAAPTGTRISLRELPLMNNILINLYIILCNEVYFRVSSNDKKKIY